jgi:hypothetical protein
MYIYTHIQTDSIERITSSDFGVQWEQVDPTKFADRFLSVKIRFPLSLILT